MLRPARPVLANRSLFFLGIAVVVLGTGCQLIAPQPSPSQSIPEPRRIITPGPFGGQLGTGGGALDLAATVKRGTLVDALSLSGNAFPLRSAQLTFQTTGTVSALPIRSGRSVRQGDRVAEITVDPSLSPAPSNQVLTAPF